VSRFHRSDFSAIVPWAIPAPEDLARGADLKLIDERTAALIPHGASSKKDAKGKPLPYRRIHFVFDADGQLAERQVGSIPQKKNPSRETYAATGAVKLLDAKGKELAAHRFTLKPAREPSLAANTKALVLLELPFRTREHILQARKLKNKPYQNLRF